MRRLLVPALLLHTLGWAAHGRRHAIQPHEGDAGRARAARGGRRAGRRAAAFLLLSAAGAGALEIPVAVSLVDLDTNGDGLVDVREFIAMPRELLEDPKRFDTFRQRIVDFRHKLFDMAEVDGDGVLNPRELDFAGYLLDEVADDGVLGEVFSSLDANVDGRIDEAEVAKRMADINDSVEGLLERMRGSEEGAPQGAGDGELPTEAEKEAEQLAVLSSYRGKKLLTEIHKNLAEADADGDGGLDMGEVRVLAERVIKAPVTI